MAGFDDHARLLPKTLVLVLTGAPSFARARRVRALAPNPLLLQSIGDLARHVALVMFGEDAIGMKNFVLTERAFRDDALPFTKEIGQHSGIGHTDLLFGVGNGEAHRAFPFTLERALLHEPANTQPLTFMRHLLCKLAWPVEKDDIVAQRQKNESQREAKHGERGGDQNETAFFARHYQA